MTLTTTITQKEKFQTSRLQILDVAKEEKATLKRLMKSLTELNFISHSVREKLLTFQGQFQQLINPSNEESAIFLYYIIEHIITPSIESGSEEQIDQLLEFETISNELLASFLPTGIDPKAYLEQLAKEEVIIQRLVIVENFFKTQINLMHNLAYVTQEQMKEKFNQMKEHLIQLSSEIEGSQSTLANRINELSHQIESATVNMDKFTDKFSKEEQKFRNLQTTIQNEHRTFNK